MLGYFMRRIGMSPLPFVIAYILGGRLEESCHFTSTANYFTSTNHDSAHRGFSALKNRPYAFSSVSDCQCPVP